MERLHITALELLELGLGVVVAAPWLAGASRVRLVSDALVAVLVLRARDPEGRLARDSKSRALAAIHQVIMARPEWLALHEPVARVEVMQRYGELLLLHDAASRGHVEVIRDTCKAMGIEQKRLDPLPARAHEFLRDAVAAALEAIAEQSQSETDAADAEQRKSASAARASAAQRKARGRATDDNVPSRASDQKGRTFQRQ